MEIPTHKKYFFVSGIFHLAVVLILILGFDFAAPLVVIENTNKNDVISAVVLGETEKSKIITQTNIKPILPELKPEQKPIAPAQPKKIDPPQKDVIALKTPKKNKPEDVFGKDLLADLEKFKKQTLKKKQLKQQQLKTHFVKTLRQQTEKSMRQQLLNEDIKLKSTESRETQGIVNKYQALIQQAISAHWVIPTSAKKKLYSMLLIRLAPGGMVLDVQIVKSSGDTALDNSARAAVFKASPLPVPSDPEAFELFRQFNLKAKPENILDNDGTSG